MSAMVEGMDASQLAKLLAEAEEKLQKERAQREEIEEELLDVKDDMERQQEKLIEMKVEKHALKCQMQEQAIKLQQAMKAQPPGAPKPGTIPKLVSCREAVPSGSKRYDEIVAMLNFIAENISLDRCAAMELQGDLCLHEDTVTLGRVLQWKMDFKKLDKLFITIPEEDADSFIGLVKRIIATQRPAKGVVPSSSLSSEATPVDAEMVGQIAAQWKVIADANMEGASPTVYIFNEVTKRAIIIGEWPISPSSPDSKGIDYTELYATYKARDAASTRRIVDLANFLTFVTENISFVGAVVFEPARCNLLLQDRETHMIPLGPFRRWRLDAGEYQGLFLSVPEEDAAVFESSIRAILHGTVTATEVAQTLGLKWRALSPLQHRGRTYVLNETENRVMIMDSWPDDSVLAGVGKANNPTPVPEPVTTPAQVTKEGEEQLGNEEEEAPVFGGLGASVASLDSSWKDPSPVPRGAKSSVSQLGSQEVVQKPAVEDPLGCSVASLELSWKDPSPMPGC